MKTKINNTESSDSLLDRILDIVPHQDIYEAIEEKVEEYDMSPHNDFYRGDWEFDDVLAFIKRFKDKLIKKYKWKIIEEFAEENYWMSIAEAEGVDY